MQAEDIRVALEDALPLRVPLLDPHSGGGQKIAELEDYMSKAAHKRGALEEGMYWATSARTWLNREWDKIEGWQPMLSGRDSTQAKIDAAKGTLRPDLRQQREDINLLIDALARQIRKLEFDHNVVSRLYTLITGSA